MLVLPLKAKNPPEHTPWVTYGLILLNLIIFCFTVQYVNAHVFFYSVQWPIIRNGVVADWAVSRAHLTLPRLIASMFLHGNLPHIAGNMLFLWIFGAAVEGRIRPLKYITLYMLAGIVGGCIQSLVNPLPGIGASGAIMGIAGAYMYMFPFAHTMVFWFFVAKLGVGNWPAWSLICYFVAFDIINGLFLKAHDGTGHITHLCGFAIGILFAMLIKAQRDNEAVSEVQATKHDMGNKLDLMSWAELDILLDHPTDNMDLVLTFCNKAVVQPGQHGERRAATLIEQYKELLLEYRDPVYVAQTLLKISRDIRIVAGAFYLTLGRKLEASARHDIALLLYRHLVEQDPTSADAGAAVMRFGRIWEGIYRNNDMARDAYETYIRTFPNGPLIDTARQALDRVGGPKVVAPIFRQGSVVKVDLDEPDEIVQETVNNADRTAEIMDQTAEPKRRVQFIRPGRRSDDTDNDD